MQQVVRTQKEVQELSKELKALLNQEGVIRVEVKVVPIKGITERQREVLLDLINKLGYDPDKSALPETSRDASRLIEYFLKLRKSYAKRGSKKTSTKKS